VIAIKRTDQSKFYSSGGSGGRVRFGGGNARKFVEMMMKKGTRKTEYTTLGIGPVGLGCAERRAADRPFSCFIGPFFLQLSTDMYVIFISTINARRGCNREV